MGIWIFSDTHFGYNANSQMWLDIMTEAHEKFIIKTIKDNYKEGDICVMCGDVFHKKESMNIFVLTKVREIYRNLSSILPVHILSGNHDIYNKNTQEISSLEMIKMDGVSNIYTYYKPSIIEYNSKKLLMLPYQKSIYDETRTLRDNDNCDYAFSHGTFNNIKYNNKITIKDKDGVYLNVIKNYTRVFNGHIHFSQRVGNLNNVGNPYQRDRNDIDNSKGLFYYCTETETETFYENNISPKFHNFDITSVLKKDLKTIDEHIDNNFITLTIPSSLFTTNSTKIRRLIENYSSRAKTLYVNEFNDDIGGLFDDDVIENISISDRIEMKLNETFNDSELKIAKQLIKNIDENN